MATIRSIFEKIFHGSFRQLVARSCSTAAVIPNSPFLVTRDGCSARVINGNAVAKHIRDTLTKDIEMMKTKCGRAPGIAVVLVGDNPASQAYVSGKAKAAREVGIKDFTHRLPASTSQAEVLKLVDELNANSEVDGLLVQLPLPEHISPQLVCDSVTPVKDVDGFSVTNLGRLYAGTALHVPATAKGIEEMIKVCGFDIKGKQVCVVGASRHVGGPISKIFSEGGFNGTVTTCHVYTPPEVLASCAKQADVLIVCAGKQGLVTEDMVKSGAVVIDVGINRITTDNGKTKLVGDVDFATAANVAGAITPVPGGVGPLTVAGLLMNTVRSAKIQLGLEKYETS